jgi:coproporphyrinogen III oxidase-like Fe-S oxidoreductase
MKKDLSSLYFGGGTPSLYNGAQLAAITEMFPIQNAEVTLELNPSELHKLP